MSVLPIPWSIRTNVMAMIHQHEDEDCRGDGLFYLLLVADDVALSAKHRPDLIQQHPNLFVSHSKSQSISMCYSNSINK